MIPLLWNRVEVDVADVMADGVGSATITGLFAVLACLVTGGLTVYTVRLGRKKPNVEVPQEFLDLMLSQNRVLQDQLAAFDNRLAELRRRLNESEDETDRERQKTRTLQRELVELHDAFRRFARMVEAGGALTPEALIWLQDYGLRGT